MKKLVKLLFVFAITIIGVFANNQNVFAASTAPETLNVKTHTLSPSPLGFTNRIIYVKETLDGEYIYCLDANKYLPSTNIVYTKSNLITDPIYNYILVDGLGDKTDKEFFATQAALWVYLAETGQMEDTPGKFTEQIKDAIYNKYPNDPIAIDIKNILTNAKKATKLTNVAPEFEFTTTSNEVTFKLDNGYYVSSLIKVNSELNDKNYDITITNEPEGTKITRQTEGFIISIPEKSIDYGTTELSIKISDSTTLYSSYKYTNEYSHYYQNMGGAFPEDIDLSDELKISITKEKPPVIIEKEPTTILISKQDITNKEELPGATLIIRNNKGEEIYRWVSTNEPKKFDNLPVGKYTLEEIIAPEGYKLSSEKISFEVKLDGKIETVVMYNDKVDELPYVSISKQDITNKEELPGATLIVRDSEGNEIDKWVSTNEPHMIRLEEGIYTLEELIAPEGYTLSSEKITFEVRNNGVVTEVVMFNTPESTIIVVPPTSASSTLYYIIGGLIVIIGSVLVYKNVKKEQ